MRIVWIGFHVEGLPALAALLDAGIRPEAVVTLAPEAAARRSGSGDYRRLCERAGLRLFEVENINDAAARTLLESLRIDLAFVIGWTQILKPETLRLARIGMIGAHASLLPADRGRAPVNWAIIRGSTETGNSLIWLAPDVDGGDLIDQVSFPISPYDTCASVYRRVAESNRTMILRVVPKLLAGAHPGRPQVPGGVLLPARHPSDGLIEWARPVREVYDFIRAQTRPYPGAFTYLHQQPLTIWHGAILPSAVRADARPGEILGPVLSPRGGACGQLVACGSGALLLLEVEWRNGGPVVAGRTLSELSWTGDVLGASPAAPPPGNDRRPYDAFSSRS